MRNVLWTCLMVAMAWPISSCHKKPCETEAGTKYYPLSDQMKKNTFLHGSYWVYQDSASGIIDSQYVYAYDTQSHIYAARQSTLSYNVFCDIYTDAFDMGVLSYWNGIVHDTIRYSSKQNGQPTEDINVIFGHQLFEYDFYTFPAGQGSSSTVLTNYAVAGRLFPRVYMDVSLFNAQIYHADGVGVVRWVFDDTISGQHTWDLLRYHVTNPR